MTLAFKCAFEYLGMSMFNSVMGCKPMLRNGLQGDSKVTQITLGISMLNIIRKGYQIKNGLEDGFW